MKENPISREYQHKLKKASTEVWQGWANTQLLFSTPDEGLEDAQVQLDEDWMRIANSNPEYSNRIMEIKNRLSIVEKTKRDTMYPAGYIHSFEYSFRPYVKHELTRVYLRDILLSRIIVPRGDDYIINSELANREFIRMGKELGLEYGWYDSVIEQASFMRKAIEATLTGVLRIDYQP